MPRPITKEVEHDVKIFMDKKNLILDKYHSFVKWVGVSSLAFLSFFVGIIPDNSLSGWSLYLYIILVSSISLGVLSVCLILYGEIVVQQRILNQVTKVLNKPPRERGEQELSQASLPFFYKKAKISFSISYILFFISFVSFSILKAFI